MFNQKLLFFFVAIFLLVSCGPESSENKEVSRGMNVKGIEISEVWARPGMKGKTSAAYLTIKNGTESADTLIGITTEAAAVAEVHDSFQDDKGMINMKPVESTIIKPNSALELEPGGAHIMLMELQRDLAMGDSLQLTLEFTNAGTKMISAPVKVQ